MPNSAPARVPSSSALDVAPEGLLDLPARVALGEVVPLVVGLLALGQREGGLDPAVLEVQVEGDEGEPALLDLAHQLVDLAPVHEHLALATRRVVGPGPLHVLGDVHVLQPHLAVVDRGEPVDEGGDRKSTRLNSSHANISYAVFCLKKKKTHKYVRDSVRPHPLDVVEDRPRHRADLNTTRLHSYHLNIVFAAFRKERIQTDRISNYG